MSIKFLNGILPPKGQTLSDMPVGETAVLQSSHGPNVKGNVIMRTRVPNEYVSERYYNVVSSGTNIFVSNLTTGKTALIPPHARIKAVDLEIEMFERSTQS